MIVPLPGSNLVRLVGGPGLNVPKSQGSLTITEVQLPQLAKSLVGTLLTGMASAAKIPGQPLPRVDDSRIFQVSGRVATANVTFSLVPSDDLVIDGADIAKSLGLKEKPETISSLLIIQDIEDLLHDRMKKNNPDADGAMFLVEQAGDRPKHASRTSFRTVDLEVGVTNPVLGVSLISDARVIHRDCMAHEAGHLLGYVGHATDARELMHAGGSPVGKITFGDAKRFNPGH